MVAVVILVAVIFGIINGWFNADTYNKTPFTEYDKRGLYEKPFLVPFALIILSITPAVLAVILLDIAYGVIALLVTFLITRVLGKYFLNKRVAKRNQSVNSLKN